MVLRVYYDLLSQPSRAVYIFLKCTGIPFEAKPVALRKGEHFGEAFTQINPFQKVPVIDDNGFVLTESVAILKYLALKYDVPEHWYPRKSLQEQVRVDEYMNWQHFNTRGISAMLFRHLLIIPRAKNAPIDWKKVEEKRNLLPTMIQLLDQYFLKGQPFLCGSKITVADLLGVCELQQLYAVHEEAVYTSNPRVRDWMERVIAQTQPHFKEANIMVEKVRQVFGATKAKL